MTIENAGQRQRDAFDAGPERHFTNVRGMQGVRYPADCHIPIRATFARLFHGEFRRSRAGVECLRDARAYELNSCVAAGRHGRTINTHRPEDGRNALLKVFM